MKSRCFKLLSCLGLLASFCMQSSSAEAIFASVKSTGMAATCVAYPLDTLVVAYNPAGLADICDRVDIEAGWVRERGHARVSGNLLPPVNKTQNGFKTKNAYVGNFGISKQLPCDMTVGLALYNRDYQKTTYGSPLVLFGTSKAGLEYVHEVLTGTWAIKICDRWNFGIAANYNVQRFKVDGIQNFDNARFSSNPGHVTNRGYDYSQGWSGSFGFRGQITDDLSIGVAYTTKAHMKRFTKYSGFLAGRGRLEVPQHVNAGIAYQLFPCLVVAFDFEWVDWKQAKALANPLLNGGVLEQLGTANGPGFGFRNQYFYRVGFDWRIDECWSVRAGYRHTNTPVRKSQTAVNVLSLDLVEDFVTVGATWDFNCCHEFSFVFAYGFDHKVNGKNSIPRSFGGGEADLKEQKFLLGLSWGWKY